MASPSPAPLADRLVREKRVEDPAQDLLRDSLARAPHRNAERLGSLARRYDDLSLARDGVYGICEPVHENLVDPARLAGR